MKLVSPNGVEIMGTVDRIDATALINNDDVTLNSDGTFNFDYAGGSEVDWDSQRTLTRNGYRLFLDEGGDIWPENELKLVDEDEEDAE